LENLVKISSKENNISIEETKKTWERRSSLNRMGTPEEVAKVITFLMSKDASFVKEYTEAIDKIKSVLRNNTKEKANLLSNRIVFRQNADNDRTSNYLSTLQLALTNFNLTKIKYHSTDTNQTTERIIEPFAIYSTQENWLLIAFCRLRKDFRAFRLDRIQSLNILTDKFEPHKITLQEYFEICKAKYSLIPLT
jgi:predicted DNA-binding transcriptional regulator YafY